MMVSSSGILSLILKAYSGVQHKAASHKFRMIPTKYFSITESQRNIHDDFVLRSTALAILIQSWTTTLLEAYTLLK